MPILPAASSSLRARSSVNSISRDWGDENAASQGQEIEWSPSPERVKHKTMPPAESKPMNGDSMDTPAQRRRRAILEAMQSVQNSESSAPSSSSRAATETLSGQSQPWASVSAPPASYSDLSGLDPSKKRPWEGNLAGKKVMDNGAQTAAKKAKLPTLKKPEVFLLSSEQQKVLSLVTDEKKNVFFTGSAGTGKSVLLREIIRTLRSKHSKSPDAVAVTASTGIAACNISGTTLHSFGGVGLALEPAEDLAKKMRRNKKAISRWTRTKVLIIDEISMVDGQLFDKFNKIAQIVRRKPDVPFGGIQLIMTGDFFQLPPVTKSGQQPTFAFEAQTWAQTIHYSINLSRVFRQKDSRFVAMLNEMRFGRLTPASITQFQQLQRPIEYDDGLEPTELFPRREDVDRANQQRLAALYTDGYSYPSHDDGTMADPVQREKMLGNFMAPKHLFLKIDAQVMLIKNMDENLVNGSIGKVIGFCRKGEWADHKGQWQQATDEDLDVDVRPKISKAKASESGPNMSKPNPVIRFNVPGGQRDVMIEADQFKTELPDGQILVSRSQLPLILSWAMSIHKAQGQTLDRVKVDLNKVFEKGQAYVALSRATSLEGLEIKGFRPEKVMAHPKVKNWSNSLQDLNV